MLEFYLDPQVKERGLVFEAPREGDAGFDIRSAESLVIPAGTQSLISTGLYLAVPAGFVGIIKDRSSMALKRVYTHAGVIDAAYRGEVKVLLSNHSEQSFQIEAGDKIAQMLVIPFVAELLERQELTELGKTSRGACGFGSTGR